MLPKPHFHGLDHGLNTDSPFFSSFSKKERHDGFGTHAFHKTAGSAVAQDMANWSSRPSSSLRDSHPQLPLARGARARALSLLLSLNRYQNITKNSWWTGKREKEHNWSQRLQPGGYDTFQGDVDWTPSHLRWEEERVKELRPSIFGASALLPRILCNKEKTSFSSHGFHWKWLWLLFFVLSSMQPVN